MSLFGGSSKSESSATDMRTVADANARAVVGNRNTRVLEAFSKSAFGNNSNYRESGSVDFSRGGKLVESGGLDMSGKGNKFVAGGGADINARGRSTVNYSVVSDQGALDKSLNFASDMLAQVLNAGKAQVTEMQTAQSSGFNQAIQDALGLSASQNMSLQDQINAASRASAGIGDQVSAAINGALTGAAASIESAQPGAAPAAKAPWYKNPLLLLLALGGGGYLLMKARKK